MEHENNERKGKKSCKLGAITGALYGFIGPLVCYCTARYIVNPFAGWGGPLIAPEAPMFAKVMFYLSVPATLPIIGGLGLSDPNFSLPFEQRELETIILLGANTLIFGGLGHLIQKFVRATRGVSLDDLMEGNYSIK